MTILLSPINPSATPLPWLLLQTPRGNYFIGSRGCARDVIARVTFSEDAELIFRAVHAYQPMLCALRMLKFKLYSDGGYAGVMGLSAQFNHQEFLMIQNALAIVEKEGRHGR